MRRSARALDIERSHIKTGETQIQQQNPNNPALTLQYQKNKKQSCEKKRGQAKIKN
jgi:hypothetical protein